MWTGAGCCGPEGYPANGTGGRVNERYRPPWGNRRGAVFAGRQPAIGNPLPGDALIAAVLAGGPPEALVRTLQPWSTNALNRLVKATKLRFLDSGLLASLRDPSPEKPGADRGLFGPMLKTFVLSELLKLASRSKGRFGFFHCRDKDRREVDVVMEDLQGRVVGIEVKASATVAARDFKGLEKLAQACGKRFVCGLV